MSKLVDVVPPRLGVEECWPVSGPPWSNLSHEHRIQADDTDWDAITSNGSIWDSAPESPEPNEKKALERRAVLQRFGIDIGVTHAQEAIDGLEDVAETLETLEGDDLALAASGLLSETKERRQALLTQHVDKLNLALGEETADIGVLMIGRGQSLMARLGGFFVKSEEMLEIEAAESDLWRPEPGVIVLSHLGRAMGQVPEDYDTNGLYLRA